MKLITIPYNMYNATYQQEAAFIAILSWNGIHKQQHIDSLLILAVDDAKSDFTIKDNVEIIIYAAATSAGIDLVDIDIDISEQSPEICIHYAAYKHTELLSSQFNLSQSDVGRSTLNQPLC